MIIFRRPIVDDVMVLPSMAAAVFLSTSVEPPSWRSWTEISSGMNFLVNWMAPTPMERIDNPKVTPSRGVLKMYCQ